MMFHSFFLCLISTLIFFPQHASRIFIKSMPPLASWEANSSYVTLALWIWLMQKKLAHSLYNLKVCYPVIFFMSTEVKLSSFRKNIMTAFLNPTAAMPKLLRPPLSLRWWLQHSCTWLCLFPDNIKEILGHAILGMEEISNAAKTDTDLIFVRRLQHRCQAPIAYLLPTCKYSDKCVHTEGDDLD